MDDEFHDLEAELKRLTPTVPSPLFVRRISNRLEPARRVVSAWWALPVAATAAVLVLLRDQPVAQPSVERKAEARAGISFKPVSATNILYDYHDDGLVTLADGTAARRIRNSYVDTITWKNPRTQASLRWSVPRTEERLVPVSFQ